MILAAIDIGSNAARLLISEAAVYADGTVDYTKLLLLRIPLRLGFDVFETGRIGSGKESQLLKTMQAYKLLMDLYKVAHFRACATSAMRDAANGPQLRQEVLQQTGINIEIISGDEEAGIIYETHIAENLGSAKSYVYIDVGGGSTEVTLFSGNDLVFKESFNIGTIRMLNNKVSDATWDYVKATVKRVCQKYQPIEAIGSGGNINKIFSLSKRKEGKPLQLDVLRDYLKEFGNCTVAERMHRYQLRADRADVIVPALLIYTSIMRWAGAEEIYVPRVGLADGLIRMLYRDNAR